MTKRKSPISSPTKKTHQRGFSGSAYRDTSSTEQSLQDKLGLKGLPSRSSAPPLGRRGKPRRLNLLTPSGGSVGFNLVIHPKFPWSVIASHLVTQAIYKGISVIDWFIIYQDLEDNHQSRDEDLNVARAILLTLSVRSGAFTHWDSRIRALKPQKVLHFIEPDDIFSDLDEDVPETISEFLSICKALQKSERDLYITTLENQMKPGIPPVLYVGVGYNDHGHLPDPTKVMVPEIEDWKPNLDCSLEEIIRLSKKYFRNG